MLSDESGKIKAKGIGVGSKFDETRDDRCYYYYSNDYRMNACIEEFQNIKIGESKDELQSRSQLDTEKSNIYSRFTTYQNGNEQEEIRVFYPSYDENYANIYVQVMFANNKITDGTLSYSEDRTDGKTYVYKLTK